MGSVKRPSSELVNDYSNGNTKLKKVIDDGNKLEVESNSEKDQEKENEDDNEDFDNDDDDDDDEDSDDDDIKTNKGKSASTTANDIHIARETAELFKSNIFKLQIDELLEQVKLKESHVLKVEKFLHKLYDMIQLVPEWEEKSLIEVDTFFKDKIVTVPFVDPKPLPSTTKYKFNYKVPSVSLIGSFALKAGIYQPQGSAIDVLLTMPEDLFEKKDFLNFRCLHKRSVYLAYLTHHLSIMLKKDNLDSFIKLEYSYLNNDPLLPILKLYCEKLNESKSNSSDYNFYKTKFSINLIVGFPYGLFDPKKLLPNRNNIRVTVENKEHILPSTPLYNFSVLSSSTHEHFLKFLYKTKKQTESFNEACILGRIWLQQRGFSSKLAHSGTLGGFGTFEFSILMAALLNGGGLNGNRIILHGFSSYQLFKGVVKYLATMDICSDGYLQFHSDTESKSSSKYVNERFQIPTLFDKVTKVNILNKMTVSSYEILKAYAKETMIMLNNVVQDQFSNIFLTNINRLDNIKFDLCYNISIASGNSNVISQLISNFGSLERVKFITLENYLVHKISSIVKFGLGDRIKLIEVELVGQKFTFPVSKRKVILNSSKNLNFECIKVKLITNGSESEKLVTKGPAHSEEPTTEAVAFKSFWDTKSSLRRFKDGSITHCCIWTTSSSEPIISTIMNFILKKHIADGLQVTNDITKEFQNLLPLPNLPSSSKTSVLNLSSFYNLKKSFDELYKIIFKMDLPLSVKSIQPVGTSFRYTSMCQPVPFAYSDPDFFQEVILEFETSQKWPDEISSLEKSKTAFLLKIQEQITTSTGGRYKSFFNRDESIPYNLEIVTLSILTPEGYGFKFRVLTERDEVLYLRAISNARNEIKPELEKTFLKFVAKYQASTRHTRTIENLSHSYEYYSPVVRLFKKWLDAHLLLGHLNDELVELIAMKPFVDRAPYFIPGSVENGFLKLIKYLSQWNWKEDPLILDLIKPEEDIEDAFETSIGANSEVDSKTLKKLSEKLTLAHYKGIQSNFNNMRNGDPNGLAVQFFVASKIDPSGIMYSSDVPLPIATRITALAKVALGLIQEHGLNKQTIKLLFTPAVKDYDFVVHLKTHVPLKSSCGIIEPTEFKNLSNDNASQFPKNLDKLSEKMDPTYQLVKYLNMKYKNTLIFSSHRYIGVNGGDKGDRNVITGLIKPLYKKAQKFKVTMNANVKPIDKENVTMNKASIFHEIAAFGNDLAVDFET
ncbi:hypothetical protein Kpol_473p1 [Vanderwaltozyma polyspora DSM 70294]|uniref:U3 small nucleolar RNA-associated protein 22 n=1 Tax=Vanderwaltozyma polyspora (strain ATCC 22028 / DSM 70294 / BCRC 21397 / CBS 2163 / NBRC 10782 / NRRL Y-8283 / UCD 57-17) TaxID=436907 RepID=A7TPZ3_VANPO|nr:uncharacterized protein Kpol_473p1 [Vanderwaltozyma polyspora DSM 70294]EDO15642.1 hypothetical protein Kpol_473p1 [Vanderwaltozyma polyspora DSM 70294]